MPIHIPTRPRKRNVSRLMPRPAPLARRSGEDPEVLAVSYRMCGERKTTIKLAKFWLTMRQGRYRGMTLPESIVYGQLQARQLEFVFQQEDNSGRVYRGGSVVDFWLPTMGLVIRVNGDYYHGQPGRRELDEIQRSTLLQGTIDGVRVTNVVDIWESRLLSCQREQAIEAALNGQELGQA